MDLSPATLELLRAAIALMALTAAMWIWMVATRLPAMTAAGLSPQEAAHTAALRSLLPSAVMRVSDNYNHLFEAPTVFYAAVMVLAISGGAGVAAVTAAWAFVALRVAHSLVQATVNTVAIRFALFVLSWLALLVLIGEAGLAVWGAPL